MSRQILRLPEVTRRTGLSRSTIYRYMNEGLFPKSILIGLKAVGWMESDIENWLLNKSLLNKKR